MLERIDFIFSYWILFWYICYELRITTYNPIGALYVGLLENIGVLLLMIYYANSYYHLLLVCFVILVTKVIPLWSLRNTTYSKKDIYMIFIYFLTYVLWLFLNNANVISFFIQQFGRIQENKPLGPFMLFMLKKENE
jgi:hypothetical protein